MEELTLIQKFDTVLKALYDISGKRPTFERILALLRVRKKNIHWAEVWDIFVKMQNEKLLHPSITDSSSKIPTEAIYLITFEGKLMYERGGLAGKIKREETKWHQRHPILYGLMSAIGGAILSLSVGLILWQVDKQSKNQEIQEIKQKAQDANQRLDSLIHVLKSTKKI